MLSEYRQITFLGMLTAISTASSMHSWRFDTCWEAFVTFWSISFNLAI